MVLFAAGVAIVDSLGVVRLAPIAVAASGVAWLETIAWQDWGRVTATEYSALLFGGVVSTHGRPALIAGAAWLALVGLAAWSYAQDWRDSDRLWSRALAVDPDSPTALYGLATTRARAAGLEQDPDARRTGFEHADELHVRALEAARKWSGQGDAGDPRIQAGLARVRAERARLEPGGCWHASIDARRRSRACSSLSCSPRPPASSRASWSRSGS